MTTRDSMSLVYFPRGYRILVSGDHVMLSTCDTDRRGRVFYHPGDADVAALYKRYRHNNEPFATWETIEYTIETIQRLIPNINQFFALQAENDFLNNHAFHFLYEIQRHIEYGTPLSPMTTIELLDDPVCRTMVGKRTPPRLNKSAYEYHQKAPWLRRWLEQPGSLEDIVCTAFVLFGPSQGQGL